LSRYLFGVSQRWYHDAEGKLVIVGEKLDEHRRGLKVIPSGFFRQLDAEHVSGVLFSNSGTIPKFNRMGLQAKYGAGTVRMLRWGTNYKWDPNATTPDIFVYEVGSPADGEETWREGTVLIRNPYALHKLPEEWLGAGAEDDLVGDQSVMTFREPFFPYMSKTESFNGNERSAILQKRMNDIARSLSKAYPQ